MNTPYLLMALLCLLFFSCNDITVRGYIIYENGKKLEGALIVSSDQGHGVRSDPNGYFEIARVNPADTLIILAAGYTVKRELALQRNPLLLVVLENAPVVPIQQKDFSMPVQNASKHLPGQ